MHRHTGKSKKGDKAKMTTVKPPNAETTAVKTTGENKTYKLALTALMAALGTVSILLFRIPIPIPGNEGIVHLGDSVIFLAVLILGAKYAAPAAAIGHASANVIAGIPFWAPWTFVIKGVMALIAGAFIGGVVKAEYGPLKKAVVKVTGMVLGGVWMIAGYYVAGGLMLGNWAAALLGIPWNIGQITVGIAIAMALEAALKKTSAGKHFKH